MTTLSFPPEHQRLMPYLVVKSATEFIKFTQEVFGAKVKMRFMRDEQITAHAEIAVGENVIMFSDAVDELPLCTSGMFIYVHDADATYVKALEAGGISLMPVTDNPYGRSGGILDPFGNSWWMKTYDPNLLP